MLQKYVIAAALLMGVVATSEAQTPAKPMAPKGPAITATPVPVKAPPPLKKLPSGLQYTFIIDKPGGRKGESTWV